jgi:hypothetical protein
MFPLSGTNVSESVSQEFDSIDAYLQAVHEILQEGHMPNIADLDDRIAQLCSYVEEAPPEIQKTCLIKLDDLLNKLNNCEDAMTSFQKISANGAIK